jgi:TRAP transporter TAXI family solute receptor
MANDGTIKTLFGMTCALLMMSVMPFASAQERITIPMLVCPFGCGPITGDTVLMNQMIQAGSPVTVLPQETPGYLYNIRAMAQDKNRWKTTVFAAEDTAVQMAAHGGEPAIKEYFPQKIVTDFKLLYGEAWWGIGKFYLTFDPDIKTIADMKGKRIGLGLRSQSDWGFYPDLLLKDAGIDESNSDIRHLTPGAMVQQLLDGNVDVVVAALGAEPHMKEWLVPGPMRQVEAAGKKMYYIGVTEEQVRKFNDKWGTTFLYQEVPADTMPRQTKPVGVAFNRGYKMAKAEFPDDVAYKLVMSVAKLGPQMRELHALWKIWSPELMMHGLSEENGHPGAKRAYVELGWWDRHAEWPPAVLPDNKQVAVGK